MDQQHIETLPPSLRQFAVGRAAGTAGNDDAEVRCYAVAEYDDAYGYNRRISTGGESLVQPVAGGGKLIGISGSELWNCSGVPQALRAVRVIRNGYF